MSGKAWKTVGLGECTPGQGALSLKWGHVDVMEHCPRLRKRTSEGQSDEAFVVEFSLCYLGSNENSNRKAERNQ